MGRELPNWPFALRARLLPISKLGIEEKWPSNENWYVVIKRKNECWKGKIRSNSYSGIKETLKEQRWQNGSISDWPGGLLVPIWNTLWKSGLRLSQGKMQYCHRLEMSTMCEETGAHARCLFSFPRALPSGVMTAETCKMTAVLDYSQLCDVQWVYLLKSLLLYYSHAQVGQRVGL